MKKTLVLSLIVMILLAACKKDKPDDKCSVSEANLTGNYKVTSIKYKESTSAPEVDYMDGLYETCEKDDILTLNSDHTYISTDVGIICSPEGTYTGDWNLSGNVFSADGEPGTLENFSCTGFVWVISDFDIPGDNLTTTYTRQ
jgi:hypothetical protein